MNCRPGDLAVIVRAKYSWLLGRMVRVTSLDTTSQRPLWNLDAPLMFPDGSGDFYDGIYDHLLRPIRPGTVTDSEVRELFAPKQPETV